MDTLKYKTYNFDISPKNVWVCGDCHGEFDLLKYKIRESGITDGVIIVAGDCGFGFEKPEYYKQTYNKIKRILKERNVTVIFIRGNHDDLTYFDGEKIDFEYWKAVPDYSILSFSPIGGINGEIHNVLCVGGAISIDRLWRKQHESTNSRLYWNNEIPIYSPEILDEINEDGVKITTVITHSAPSFAPLHDKNFIQSFIQYDKALIEDIAYERLTLTQIYDHLVKKDKHDVKLWCYGHFHQHALTYSEEDVKFIMLDICNPRNNSWDIYPIER